MEIIKNEKIDLTRQVFIDRIQNRIERYNSDKTKFLTYPPYIDYDKVTIVKDRVTISKRYKFNNAEYNSPFTGTQGQIDIDIEGSENPILLNAKIHIDSAIIDVIGYAFLISIGISGLLFLIPYPSLIGIIIYTVIVLFLLLSPKSIKKFQLDILVKYYEAFITDIKKGE